MRFYDAHGRHVVTPFDERVLGIGVEQIRRTRRRIGVAGGRRKFAAIRAALRGGWLSTLITDDASARRLVARTHLRRPRYGPALVPSRRPRRPRHRRRQRHRPAARHRARRGRRRRRLLRSAGSDLAGTVAAIAAAGRRAPPRPPTSRPGRGRRRRRRRRARARPAAARAQLRRHRQRRAGRGDAARPVAEGARGQPRRRLPVLPGRGARDAARRRRRDRQHRLDVRHDRQPRPAAGPLQQLQGRGDPPEQEPRDGVGRPRPPRQQHQPRLHRDADEPAARSRRAGQALRADTPLGRMATVDEMVGPAVFLVSEAAASAPAST